MRSQPGTGCTLPRSRPTPRWRRKPRGPDQRPRTAIQLGSPCRSRRWPESTSQPRTPAAPPRPAGSRSLPGKPCTTWRAAPSRCRQSTLTGWSRWTLRRPGTCVPRDTPCSSPCLPTRRCTQKRTRCRRRSKCCRWRPPRTPPRSLPAGRFRPSSCGAGKAQSVERRAEGQAPATAGLACLLGAGRAVSAGVHGAEDVLPRTARRHDACVRPACVAARAVGVGRAHCSDAQI